jgi:hypothetical protein
MFHMIEILSQFQSNSGCRVREKTSGYSTRNVILLNSGSQFSGVIKCNAVYCNSNIQVLIQIRWSHIFHVKRCLHGLKSYRRLCTHFEVYRKIP